MIDNSRRGLSCRAVRYIQNPGGKPDIYLGHQGTILHEIPEDSLTRHKIYVEWDVGPAFYCFAEEIQISVEKGVPGHAA